MGKTYRRKSGDQFTKSLQDDELGKKMYHTDAGKFSKYPSPEVKNKMSKTQRQLTKKAAKEVQKGNLQPSNGGFQEVKKISNAGLTYS